MKMEPRAGFNWGKVAWSHADGRIAPICSYCSGTMSDTDVPLMLWKPSGDMAHFCQSCTAKWWFG